MTGQDVARVGVGIRTVGQVAGDEKGTSILATGRRFAVNADVGRVVGVNALLVAKSRFLDTSGENLGIG